MGYNNLIYEKHSLLITFLYIGYCNLEQDKWLLVVISLVPSNIREAIVQKMRAGKSESTNTCNSMKNEKHNFREEKEKK